MEPLYSPPRKRLINSAMLNTCYARIAERSGRENSFFLQLLGVKKSNAERELALIERHLRAQYPKC
jgi:hypothetical protein